MLASVLLLCSACLAPLGGCASDESTTSESLPPAPAPSDEHYLLFTLGGAPLETVATGLEVPWSFAFTSNGRIFLTERPGRIRVIEDGSLRSEPWAVLDVYASDPDFLPEAGLMGIAVSPDFDETGHVYVMGTFWRSRWARSTNFGARIARRLFRLAGGEPSPRWEHRIYRYTERGGVGADPLLVISGIPAHPYHAGGALAFDPAGFLFVGIGDATEPRTAQRLEDPGGKILRYHPDGSIPADNPVAGSAVHALGLRNPQGLAWHPEIGAFLGLDHGPTSMPQEGFRFGHDELNVIQSGENYGWPEVIGSDPDTRFRSPVITWNPAIAPAGLAVFDMPGSAWRGDALVASLRGHGLVRLVVEADTLHPREVRVVREEPLLDSSLGRIRAVGVAPDGYVYVGTSNRDGRGNPETGDDRILRFRPGFAQAEGSEEGGGS
jgi:aldose sugar dehydrogenase